MKRFYVMDNELFKAYKTRADLTVRHNIECIDEPIRRVIIELNRLKGVAPVWSCSSHPETKKRGDRKMHVVCAVTQNGAKWLDLVYQKWTELLIEDGIFHMPCLGIVRLVKLDSCDFPFTADDLYYAIELKVEYVSSIAMRRAILTALEEAIRDVSF